MRQTSIQTIIPLALALAIGISAQTGNENPTLRPPTEKSELLAYGLAAIGTSAPILTGALLAPNNFSVGALLITGGALIGPSVGQFYAGSNSQAWTGSLIRGAGMALMVYGGVQEFDCEYGGNQGENCPVDGNALIFAGEAVVFGGALYSLIDTHFAVKRANVKIKEKHFGFSPEIIPSSGGTAVGMRAWGRF